MHEAPSYAYMTSCATSSVLHFQIYATTFLYFPQSACSSVLTLAADFTATCSSGRIALQWRSAVTSNDTQGKDRPYLQERRDGTITGSITLLHLRPPKNFGVRRQRMQHIFWTDTVPWQGMANHTTQPCKSTLRSLSPTFVRRQNTLVYKIQKNIHIIIIVQITLQGTLLRYVQALFLLLCTYWIN